MKTQRQLTFLVAALLVLISASSASAQTRLRFFDDRVSALGGHVTPGDAVQFFFVAWPDRPWHPHLMTRSQLRSADHRGIAIYQMSGEPVPLKSIWCAVNLETGEYVIDTPPDYPLVVEDFPPSALGYNPSSQKLEYIDLSGRRLEIMVIRPGKGAWRLGISDGDQSDLNGPNNRAVRTHVGSFNDEFGKGNSLTSLERGDVVVVVDPRTMSVLHTVVES